jgi:hypothetical protein
MTPRQIVVLLAVVPLLVALGRGASAEHHPQAADDVPSEVASVWFDQLYDLVTAERITAHPASGVPLAHSGQHRPGRRDPGACASGLASLPGGDRCPRAGLGRGVSGQDAGGCLRALGGAGPGGGRGGGGLGRDRRLRDA